MAFLLSEIPYWQVRQTRKIGTTQQIYYEYNLRNFPGSVQSYISIYYVVTLLIKPLYWCWHKKAAVVSNCCQLNKCLEPISHHPLCMSCRLLSGFTFSNKWTRGNWCCCQLCCHSACVWYKGCYYVCLVNRRLLCDIRSNEVSRTKGCCM